MPIVVGVTFRSAGQMHYYDPAGWELREGDAVIAPTPRGTELGHVMTEPRETSAEDLDQPLRKIKRKATPEDLRREEENHEHERRAFTTCAERIQEHGLPMKLIEAHYTFDRTRIVFYFSAEGRVDFRRLVRDLAAEFKTRVELHQVGVRDEAKLIGGFGPCGRPLCCATFISNLQPVAIKMAKEQDLALNPLKISGVCGRLMCCLSYEYECYRQAKAEMPRVGTQIEVAQGSGRVAEVNVIKGTLTVAFDDGTQVEVAAPCACSAAAGRTERGMPDSARAEQATPRRAGAPDREKPAQPQGQKRPRRRGHRSRPRKSKKSEGQGR